MVAATTMVYNVASEAFAGATSNNPNLSRYVDQIEMAKILLFHNQKMNQRETVAFIGARSSKPACPPVSTPLRHGRKEERGGSIRWRCLPIVRWPDLTTSSKENGRKKRKGGWLVALVVWLATGAWRCSPKLNWTGGGGEREKSERGEIREREI